MAAQFLIQAQKLLAKTVRAVSLAAVFTLSVAAPSLGYTSAGVEVLGRSGAWSVGVSHVAHSPMCFAHARYQTGAEMYVTAPFAEATPFLRIYDPTWKPARPGERIRLIVRFGATDAVMSGVAQVVMDGDATGLRLALSPRAVAAMRGGRAMRIETDDGLVVGRFALGAVSEALNGLAICVARHARDA